MICECELRRRKEGASQRGAADKASAIISSSARSGHHVEKDEGGQSERIQKSKASSSRVEGVGRPFQSNHHHHHHDDGGDMPPKAEPSSGRGADEDEDPSQLHVDGMSSSRTTNSREKLRLCQVSVARRQPVNAILLRAPPFLDSKSLATTLDQ